MEGPLPGDGRTSAPGAHVQRCIASSSKLDYIGRCLDRMLLADWFEHRFSGHDVERGKPHPDLFLKPAATLGISPSDCVVIEDSPTGVVAGKAAGMFTFGLCAGRHIKRGHPDRLTEAGTDMIAESFDQIAEVLRLKIAPRFNKVVKLQHGSSGLFRRQPARSTTQPG